MTRIIVTTSGKGGVGKTTVTANLGMALARLGRKVVLIDADFGLRNLDLLLGLENRIVYTALEVLSGDCRLEQALVKDKRQPGLCLLPATQSRTKESIKPEHMLMLVKNLTPKYDYVIIDCPAGIEMGFRNAIAPAQEALIITTPEISAVRDADRVVGLLEAHNIKKIHLIVNRLRPKMVSANEMMSVEDVQEILSIPLIGIVPDDEQVIVSTNKGEPLVLSDEPSKASIAFNNIAQRIEGKQVDWLDLEEPDNTFWTRVKKFFSSKII